ncbi:MAG TPA: ABC transporter permease [Tepidiformaceae bacterium]|nr:ABC transporter permease [Tepidiformaceae bacterium]
MGRYVTQRLLLAGLTLVLVSIIVFTLLRVIVPLVYGDAVDIIAAEYGGTDPELVQELKDDYGLSDALVPQYLRWVGSILRGDLGESLFNGRPVSKEIQDRLPVSVELGLVGLISSVIFSVPLGIAAAVAQNRWPDYFLRTSAILVDSIPGFWLAIMIITFGSVWFNWAPPLRFEYLHDDPVTHLKIMALPALLIGLTPSGSLIRLVRTQMLEVMRQDYIRTAHAKGLSGRAVVISHAVRNAILPVVTVIGLSLPGLIAGTAIFESIFSLPGMGQYLVSSVGNLDYPVIMATVFIFSVLIVLSNLAVDISYTIIDPRIRL